MNDTAGELEIVRELAQSVSAIKTELAKKIVGQGEVIDDLLACFLTQGHALLIGVPGLAKTTLIQSLSQTLDLQFNRIQFTPDLMPSDITGSEILIEDRASGARELKFVKGPLFANLVLADEINRTPPKTQSALLQAMQEREVTASGKTFSLPSPFWVLATQNPIEQEGTYPLPEAQLDRFMFSIEMTYPDKDAEFEIARTTTRPSTESIKSVVSAQRLATYRDLVWRVPIADSVVAYAVALARATRPGTPECPESVSPFLTWGTGPRAAQFLVLAAKAYAVLDGRPTPDQSDIERAAPSVLKHRLVRSFHAEVESIDSGELVKRIVSVVPH